MKKYWTTKIAGSQLGVCFFFYFLCYLPFCLGLGRKVIQLYLGDEGNQVLTGFSRMTRVLSFRGLFLHIISSSLLCMLACVCVLFQLHVFGSDSAKKDLGQSEGSKMKSSLLKVVLKVNLLYEEHLITKQQNQHMAPLVFALSRAILHFFDEQPLRQQRHSEDEKQQQHGDVMLDVQPVVSAIQNMKLVLLDIIAPHIKKQNLELAKNVFEYFGLSKQDTHLASRSSPSLDHSFSLFLSLAFLFRSHCLSVDDYIDLLSLSLCHN